MIATFSNFFESDTLILSVFVIPVLGCFYLNKRLHTKQPNVRPFRWGYWFGIVCFFVPLIAVGDTDRSPSIDTIFIIAEAIYIPVGIFVLRRHRWALVASTILSINPLLWIINYSYISNRWAEMNPSGTEPSPNPTTAPPTLDTPRAPTKRDFIGIILFIVLAAAVSFAMYIAR